MTLAMTTGTWGISGPTFLVAYVLLAAAVWVAAARQRRALAGGPGTKVLTDLTRHPHDVAYLNRGPELAVTSALTAMHLKGTVAPVKGQIHAVGRLEPGADALERAIHFTTGTPVLRARLPLHRSVRTALDATHARLVTAGALLSDAQRRRIRAVGWWLGAVAVLGLLRLLAGVAEGRPVAFLIVALMAVTAVAAVQLVHAPRRSRAGDRLLAQLTEEQHALHPDQRPDWVTYGPAAAALGVGIFGTSALWASDPAFAEELAVQKGAVAGGSDGGGSFYFSGGGDAGSGGGDGGGGGGGCGGGCGG